MENKLPTIIDVRYERARSYEVVQVPRAIWRYHIESANEDVYGFAGGLLTQNAEGLWTAHYWEHAVGAPAETRQQAILNVLPLAAAVVAKHRDDRAAWEAIYNVRNEAANKMKDLFPAGCGLVTVRDTTVTHDQASPKARFRVSFTFDNLTEEQVILLAAKQQERK